MGGFYGILDVYVSYKFADTMCHDRIWSFVSQEFSIRDQFFLRISNKDVYEK